jgi:hypothetical protein
MSGACSDTGSGTQAVPYCTIQAAASVATAGDTVLVSGSAAHGYTGGLTIANSGTASAPITFESTGAPIFLTSSLKISGSYIDVSGGSFNALLTAAATVTGSYVTLDGDRFSGGETVADVQVGAHVNGLTISRSILTSMGNESAVQLGADDANTALTGDILGVGTEDLSVVGSGSAPQASTSATDHPAIVASADSNTDITGNTIGDECFSGVSVTGSTGTSIENNIISANSCQSSGWDDLRVDAASAGSTTEGYNLLSTVSGRETLYSWGGKSYSTQSAFAAATGQGGADVAQSSVDISTDGIDGAASGTANAAAPGEPTSDLYGNAWPQLSPDRGAVAQEEYSAANVSLTAVDFSPQQVQIELDLHGVAWGSSLAMAVDWGDGSAVVDEPIVDTPWWDFSDNVSEHIYAQRGTYTVTVTLTDAAQKVTRTTTVSTNGSTYVPVDPTRVLDTRSGLGAPEAVVGPHGTVAFNVTSGVSLPAGMGTITAVVMNVTATDETGKGVVTAYPDGTTVPASSSLNYSAGENIPNLVTVRVGADDEVDLDNGSAASTDLIADVEGYYVASSAGAFYAPNAPKRILDTRNGTGVTKGAVAAGGTVSVSVPDCTVNGASTPATAVAVNVTAVGPSANGLVTAYPDQTSLPTASNINYYVGENVPNMVVVKVGADGSFDLHNTSSGTVQLVADLEGCYSATLGDAFVPVDPYRALDTRTGLGQNFGPPTTTGTPAGADLNAEWNSSESDPDGSGGGSDGPTAAVLNVTVTQPTASGVITAYETSAGRPSASNLNFKAGQTVPNLVMVPCQDGFGMSLYNDSTGTTDLIVDVYGYFS